MAIQSLRAPGGTIQYQPTQYQKTYDPNAVYGGYNRAMQDYAKGSYNQLGNWMNAGMGYLSNPSKPWQMTGDIGQMTGNMAAGALNQTDELARRMGRAGVASARGGYGAGAVPGTATYAQQGIKDVAGMYGQNYNTALGHIGDWQNRQYGLWGQGLGALGGLAGTYATNWGQGVRGLSDALMGQETGYNAANATNARALNDYQLTLSNLQRQMDQESAARTQASTQQNQQDAMQKLINTVSSAPYGTATPSNAPVWEALQKLRLMGNPQGGLGTSQWNMPGIYGQR